MRSEGGYRGNGEVERKTGRGKRQRQRKCRRRKARSSAGEEVPIRKIWRTVDIKASAKDISSRRQGQLNHPTMKRAGGWEAKAKNIQRRRKRQHRRRANRRSESNIHRRR